MAHRPTGLDVVPAIGDGSLVQGETVGPQWIRPTLRVGEGQDPLGYLSMTQDRFLPWLLPGILELSAVARYFSLHTFLLDEYRRRGLPPGMASLGRFIKSAEWDLGLAVQRCPRRCGYSPVGARRLHAVADDRSVLPRGESVQGDLGGYGLYYRSPLADLGLVARRGSMLGDRATPIDVLRPNSARAARLAAEYRAAVEDTSYVRHFLGGDEPLPLAVVEEYAERACLCRLPDRPSEQAAVYAALFTADQVGDDDHGEATQDTDALHRRRQGAAHLLSIIGNAPSVAVDQTEFRRQLWASTGTQVASHRAVAERWAALAVKDVWQEAIASLWADFCRRGLQGTRDRGRGLDLVEVRGLAADMVLEAPELGQYRTTTDLVAAIAAGYVMLPVGDRNLDPAAAELEDLRAATARLDSGASALVVLSELVRRVRDRAGKEWTDTLGIASAWQPSVRDALSGLDQRLASGEPPADTLWWLLDVFVVGTHERIAYSKLPDNTFRFRWEEGLLRFFDNGAHRFPLASVRHWPLTRLTFDLGLWENRDEPKLSVRGAAFIHEVFP